MPHNVIGDKSTLVQVMTWCRQTKKNITWANGVNVHPNLSPYGVTRPQRWSQKSHRSIRLVTLNDILALYNEFKLVYLFSYSIFTLYYHFYCNFIGRFSANERLCILSIASKLQKSHWGWKLTRLLTHWGLETPPGDIHLGQHWLR